VERRLAAILAADVVGYSSLMEADEAGTFERLKAHRSEIFEPDIKLHRGRIFNLMGDGLLAEFGSVVDAVECAVAVQKAMAKRNDGLAPEKRIDIRIGVNLGDVIVEGEDRHGEGVNIAARHEQLAPPGGICVSQTVIDHLINKLPIGFDAMGEHQVKNIAKPVAVYRARLDGAPVKRAAQAAAKPRWVWAAVVAAVLLLAVGAWYALRTPAPGPVVADAKPSLVVLPFDNLSDDKEQGYLADGITEDLTTELARVPGLFVISRNAAFTYKGKAIKPAEIAKELGVRYILEGSTRRAGEEMRINAQLIDAQTGGHLWAERFDGKWAEVFTLQDKVVENVAGALELRLVTGEGKAEIAGGTSNPAAYEAFLRGLELELRNTPEDIVKAVTLYQQAIALDPNFGRATAELAWVYWNADDQRNKALGLSWEESEAKLYEYLAAAAQHPSPTYYQISAQLLTRERKSDEAIAGLQKAVALDPSDPWTVDGLSQALIFNGHPKEARAYLDAAVRLDPAGLGGLADWRHYLAGLAAFGENRFEDAVASLEKIDLRWPDPWTKFYGLQVLLAAYGHLGRSAQITATSEKLKAVLLERDDGELNMLLTQQFFVFKNEADIQRLLDGLSKAGVPELPAGVDPHSKDRLTEAEIRSLYFGHEVQGRRTAPKPAEYKAITSADGSTSVTVGSLSEKGMVWTQAGVFCLAFPKDLTSCGAIFRNPSGSFEQKNEYLAVRRWNRFEFSVVK
jgi:TolB-like protein/class 3 adenylate cyclase